MNLFTGGGGVHCMPFNEYLSTLESTSYIYILFSFNFHQKTRKLVIIFILEQTIVRKFYVMPLFINLSIYWNGSKKTHYLPL